MKILHVAESFYPSTGGGQKHMMDLCNALINQGHTSDVLTINRMLGSRKKLPKHEKVGKINIYRIPFLNLKYYNIPRPFFKRTKKYDIIHVHTIGFFSDFLVLTKFIHRKPIVLATHGGFFHTKKIMFLKKLYFNLWLRHILRGINRVIANSLNDQKLFSKITKNISCVPNAIVLKDFKKIKREPEKGMLIFVGRLSKNKRVDKLLEVVNSLKDKDYKSKLHVVGNDIEGLRKDLENKARKMGIKDRVVFTGEVSDKDLLRMLGKASFFLSASEYEGFGISVLEAMAAGVPVIVNDIKSFRNFVENEKNGFIANFSDPEEVADLIIKLSKKEMTSISKESRATAMEYDWEKASKKIEKIYKDILNG